MATVSVDLKLHEQRCLAEVRSALNRRAAGMRLWRKRLLDVRLEGSFPETRLVVDFYDDYSSRERSEEFGLWTRDSKTSEWIPSDAPEGWGVIVPENVVLPPGS